MRDAWIRTRDLLLTMLSHEATRHSDLNLTYRICEWNFNEECLIYIDDTINTVYIYEESSGYVILSGMSTV